MADKIKEILDCLKPKYDIVDELGNDYKKVKFKDCKLLLDYITNLQQEKEYYENEYQTLIEQLSSNTFFKYENQAIDGVYVLKQRNDYKSRCEKAIEYLENLWSFPSGNFEVAINKEENKSIDIDGNEYIDNLLNILNGSDENERRKSDNN